MGLTDIAELATANGPQSPDLGRLYTGECSYPQRLGFRIEAETPNAAEEAILDPASATQQPGLPTPERYSRQT
jgi:hypothetical protein